MTMLFYNILLKGCVNGKIGAAVFEDTKLNDLLNHFLAKEQVENVVDVLKDPLQPDDIELRQELFLELEKDHVEQYLLKLKDELWQLTQSYETYAKTPEDKSYKQIHYANLMLAYVRFVEGICNKSVYEASQSLLLREFIQSFLLIQATAQYTELSREVKSLKGELVSIGTIMMDINTTNAVPRKVRLKKETKPFAASELMEVAQQFGIDKRQLNIKNEEMTQCFMDALAKLYPEIFNHLTKFYHAYKEHFNPEILNYTKQISFYLNMKALYTELRNHNVPISMPMVTTRKDIKISSAYDISLLVKMESGIVPNEVDFNESQGFFILTGANGGGKTAYLRMLGICQILFLAGGYIPAIKGVIYPFNKIYTHFPVEESLDGVGRLKEEQRRVAEILSDVDENSMVLLNETFSSTNEELSVGISYELLQELCKKGAYGIFVTHQHQLCEAAKSISARTRIDYLTTRVLQDDKKTRTYKIIKNSTDNCSYAQSVLERYGLSRERLLERFSEVD